MDGPLPPTHTHHAQETSHTHSATRANISTEVLRDFVAEDESAPKTLIFQHGQHWTNRMILGDSLLVMTSLAEKEGLKGPVQVEQVG